MRITWVALFPTAAIATLDLSSMNEPDETQQARAPFHVLAKPIGPVCNLRCAYCFYLDKTELYPPDENWRMTDEVLARFTRQYIAGQPDGTGDVNFAWQGGEPTLMGIDFFRRALQWQGRYARPAMTISNALQTNGVLLDDDWGEFLHESNFLVGLSIDGPKELHNTYRLDPQGRGSFDAVIRGFEAMKAHRVEVNALTVVQRENADHAVEVYDFLVDAGFRHIQFVPIVEHVGGGRVSERTVLPAQWGRFLCKVFDRWCEREHVGEVFVQLFDVTLGIALGYPASLCTLGRTCGRAVALEHNGDLYSCDHWVTKENLLGNIADKTLAQMVDSDFQTRFGADKFNKLPTMCLECPYLRYCHGACPKDRIATTPDGQPGLQHVCAGYRMFFAHALPTLHKMADCIRMRRPASDYRVIDRLAGSPRGGGRPGRNDPCPCGSGRKYKNCCAKKR